MTISQLARQAGVSARALRHYEQIGLLKPAPRDRSGYRRYDPSDLARVQQIRSLLALGLSLREVGQVLTTGALCPRRLVELQLARVDREVDKLKTLRGKLARLLDSLDSGGPATREDLLTTLEAMNVIEKTDLDPIVLELGKDLLWLCDLTSERALLTGIKDLRTRLKEQGIFLPGVRVKDEDALEAPGYRLTLLQRVTAQGRLHREQLLAVGEPEQLAGLGQPEPVPGLTSSGAWIGAHLREQALGRGCQVLTPLEVILGHLMQVFQEHRAQLRLVAPSEACIPPG